MPYMYFERNLVSRVSFSPLEQDGVATKHNAHGWQKGSIRNFFFPLDWLHITTENMQGQHGPQVWHPGHCPQHLKPCWCQSCDTHLTKCAISPSSPWFKSWTSPLSLCLSLCRADSRWSQCIAALLKYMKAKSTAWRVQQLSLAVSSLV